MASVREDIRREIFDLHASLCKALADPKRLLIIETLREGERSVGDISADLELSQSNASQHLAILRQRGVVRARRVGSNVCYRLTDPKILEALDLLRDVLTAQLAGDTRLHEHAQQISLLLGA